MDVIARLRALRAAVTTGNWYADYSEIVADDGTLVARRMFESDAELVAATINALPLLLDVCEAARAVRLTNAGKGEPDSEADVVLDAALARLEATDGK